MVEIVNPIRDGRMIGKQVGIGLRGLDRTSEFLWFDR